MSASADISKMLAGFRKARARAVAAATKAVTQFGAVVIGQSQELTPVDTGFLQGSGTWENAVANGNSITATIGHNASYAAAVHERLDVHHEVGQAKYLANAMRSMESKFLPFVAERVDRAMNG